MDKIVIAAVASAIALVVANNAFAADATITDHHKYVEVSVPKHREVCRNVQVEKPSQGFDLGSAIIGGIIGNNIGNGNGNGAAGAVIGGLIGGAGKTTHVERRCHTETYYVTESQRRYSHSTVTFYHNGRKQTLRFTR